MTVNPSAMRYRIVMILFMIAMATLDPAFARLRAEDARVATIAWRLQTRNAELCPSAVALPGLSLEALSIYPQSLRSEARQQLGLGDHVAISAVASGGAAASAGLRPGDAILSIGGVPTPAVSPDATGYGVVARIEDALAIALAKGEALMVIRRGQEDRAVRLRGATGCASIVQIVPGRGLNALADGRYVQINKSLLDFVRTDDELAAVVAHELAHNILQHRARKTPSKQAEYDADRLSVWLVGRAGYDTDAILPFWTRLEKRTNLGILSDGTHPSTKRRLVGLNNALAYFKAQRAAGKDLIPPTQ